MVSGTINQALTGEFGVSATWSEIDADARLRLPREITDRISWCVTGEKCEVLLEPRERGSILIHGGSRCAEIVKKRQDIFAELDDKTEALRRIAISHIMFIPAVLGRTNRRVTLPSELLFHLGASKLSRVLCLAYANQVEVLSEALASERIDATRADIDLKS